MSLPRLDLFRCILYLFTASLFAVSCSDDAGERQSQSSFEDPLENLSDAGPLNFEDPEVGQRSTFVLFKAEFSNETNQATFSTQGDTLVVAITEERTDRWIITEFLTEGSLSRTGPNRYWWNMADSVCRSNLRIANDSISVDRNPTSRYITFAFPQPQKFPLGLVSDDAPERANADPIFGIANASRWTGYLENYNHYGSLYPRLNAYFNYTEVAFDGWGYTYIYSPTDGLIRMAWVSAWSANVAVGWDLIPR